MRLARGRAWRPTIFKHASGFPRRHPRTGSRILQKPIANGLAAERASIERSGSLHWFHWLIVLLSLVLTVVAWYFAKTQVAEKSQLRFQREADQVLALVGERMKKYEEGLWAGVAAIQAHGGDMTYGEWKRYAASLRIDVRYPGINGIGVIHHVPPQRLNAYLAEQRRARPDYRIHPPHDQAEFLPITFIEPSAINRKAEGLDMAHEANRYGAARKARASGDAQITGPIVLVQDAGQTPGFLFYVPYYSGVLPRSAEERQNRFSGMVYAPFVFHKLMEGVLGKEQRQVRISVQDGGSVLYDERRADDAEYDPAAAYSTRLDLEMHGRTWTFDILSTRSFQKSNENGQPMMILAGGITIDVLLFSLFVFLRRANRRAIGFADRLTETLQHRTDDLERSNAELAKFAYVASHDLKTPLRGIGDLIEYLEEDLETYLDDPSANPDVRRNIDRLHQQRRRMDGLIKGILDYSNIGSGPPALSHMDTAETVRTLAAELKLRDDQLVLNGKFPVLVTDAVRLGQIFANLMGNAVKYHDDISRGRITVSADSRGDRIVFSVEDDGPGIDPRFHDRIFDVFQTLQPKDEIESTGIGLSIVKKAVEVNGGTIELVSQPAGGAKFTFDWPRDIGGRTMIAIAAE